MARKPSLTSLPSNPVSGIILGKVFNFPSLGWFLNCIPLFRTQYGKAAVSNRHFLSWLAVPEIRFQSIICSRHNFPFQLCVLLYDSLQFLRASEIADQITLFSCNIKLLMVSGVLVFRLDQFPHYLTSQVVSRLSGGWSCVQVKTHMGKGL